MTMRWSSWIRPIRKVKTRESQEVLQRLQLFLESDDVIKTPVRILTRFWEDQQCAIGYSELRQIVQDGTVSPEALQLWSQDYSTLVANQFYSVWMDAVKAGAARQPLLDDVPFSFRAQTKGILNWIRDRGAEFVTVCTEEQKRAIATLLTKSIRDHHTVEELSQMIRPCIGLTKEQAKANFRYYHTIATNLRNEHPRMKAESIQRKAQEAAQKYAERQHRQRAMTIAQTESAFAYNYGADESIRQAQAQNLLGEVKKRWCTSGDDAVCEICASLDGMELEMDVDFKIKGKALFRGQHRLPPAHPRCACAVEYIEVERAVSSSSQLEPEINRDIEDIDYFIREHVQGQDISEELKVIEEAINSVPMKVRKELSKGTIIDVGQIGASQYDYRNDIMYVAKNAEVEDVIHEIGHMVENKMLSSAKVNALMDELISHVSVFEIMSDIYEDAAGNPREVFLLKNEKFVSEYQGRLYVYNSIDAFHDDGSLKKEVLMEFISEPFRVYVMEQERLKKDFVEFYELLREVVE